MNVRAACARLLLRSIGRSSDGIRLCMEHGLTAGKTVDYVYRNQPSGRGWIGRQIDRRFLSDPGWEAVRIRRRNLEQLLREAIRTLHDDGRTVSLLDIASGPAAYILAVWCGWGEPRDFARCCDFDERWLHEGEAEADRLGLRNVKFERGDAFNRDAILALRPSPNLAVASGFYDWITDDELVRRSLEILFAALEPGGFVVLTNQMGHPDLEFVSAVFTDFHHEPLRMKMRPAAQIQQWLTDAGFVTGTTLTDSKNYYSVTSARKPEERTWTSASTT
jgi:hypothetical protein